MCKNLGIILKATFENLALNVRASIIFQGKLFYGPIDLSISKLTLIRIRNVGFNLLSLRYDFVEM